MSTRVGTLQAPRAGGSILLAAFLASFVMATIALVAISLDSNEGRQGETTFVGRQVVNTPGELSAGTVGGAEQTFGSRGDPSALRQQYGIVGGAEQTFVGGTAANTPSELSGWSSPPASRHRLMTDTLGTNTPAELSGGIVGGLPGGVLRPPPARLSQANRG